MTEHDTLTGLGDDDHTQYHNNTRGDARYYTKSQVDSAVAGKTQVSIDSVPQTTLDIDSAPVTRETLGAGLEIIAARLYSNAASQTLTTDTWTAVTLNSTSFNNDSGVFVVSSGAITVPPGLYLVTAQVWFGGGSNGWREIIVTYDGPGGADGNVLRAAMSGTELPLSGSDVALFSDSVQLKLWAFAGGGTGIPISSAAATQTFLSVARLA